MANYVNTSNSFDFAGSRGTILSNHSTIFFSNPHTFVKILTPIRNPKNTEAASILKRMSNHFNLLLSKISEICFADCKWLKFGIPIWNAKNTFTVSPNGKFVSNNWFFLFERKIYWKYHRCPFFTIFKTWKFYGSERFRLGTTRQNWNGSAPSEHASCKSYVAFLRTCLNFYVELMKQINARFPFNELDIRMLKEVSFIDPTTLSSVKSIATSSNFFQINILQVDQEFRQFRLQFKDDTTKDIDEFWKKVKSYKKSDGSYTCIRLYYKSTTGFAFCHILRLIANGLLAMWIIIRRNYKML